MKRELYVNLSVEFDYGLLNIMNGLYTAFNPRDMCRRCMDVTVGSPFLE